MIAQPGIFVCLVGPSGAGKDTLLRLVKQELAQEPGFFFPRRSVTRPQSPDEDHLVLSETAYAEGLRGGLFTLAWRAHGFGYAIDRDVLPPLAAGEVVICNLSRDAIAAAKKNFPHTVAVLVTAPATELAARLSARGREAPADVRDRLARNHAFAENFVADFVIDNSGSAAIASEKFASILRGLLAKPPPVPQAG